MSNEEIQILLKDLKKEGLNYKLFERENRLTDRCINVFLRKGILTDKNKTLIIKGFKNISNKIQKYM